MNDIVSFGLHRHVEAGRPLDREQALALAEATDTRALMALTAPLRDRGFRDVVTYSRKVFLPLTKLCRDVCHYCTFASTAAVEDTTPLLNFIYKQYDRHAGILVTWPEWFLWTSCKGLLALVLSFISITAAHAGAVPGANIHDVMEAKRIDAMLRQPVNEMDLARIKLTIDKMIDPAIDVDAGLKQIDSMAMQVRAMLRGVPSDNEKLHALRTYLYEKGSWNSYQPYGYDFDDPLGKSIRNKLLTQYLSSKKGNCVTMPLLFVMLGQRLGLDVTISTVPLHLFVKYTDRVSGTTFNLETTSGAHPARDAWIRQQNPMTDTAIVNGLYMQKLSKREVAAEMATLITTYLLQTAAYEKVIALSDVILKHYPNHVSSMLWKASACGRLVEKSFVRKYPTPDKIPAEEFGYFQYLEKQNRALFSKAEALGWREPKRSDDNDYIQRLSRARVTQ